MGTITVEVSELISRLLKRRGVKHNVLNAKYHQKEAEIVAHAGKAGAVTIATNMAGRGTDIKLDPVVMKCEKCGIGSGEKSWKTKTGEEVDPSECAKDVPCGLHIIGTERHEARRIDRQLRGRAGRQGDPGSSLFFLSLEDDLMRMFGSGRVSGVMDKMGLEEGDVITHSLVTRAIEKAQQRVENYNFDIRKRLIDYDDVMNRQREAIYGRRDEIIEASELGEIILAMIDDVIEAKVNHYIDPKELPENWPLAELSGDIEGTLLFSFPSLEADIQDVREDDVIEHLKKRSREALVARERFLAAELGSDEVVREFEKYVLLQTIDEKWMDHLHELDNLKEGIHFRAYAQKDPLIEYKKEAYALFADLNDTIDQDALHAFFHARIAARRQSPRDYSSAQEVHKESSVYGLEGGGMGASAATDAVLSKPMGGNPAKPTVRQAEKVPRNDPCPCGSGKKYKRCCGS